MNPTVLCIDCGNTRLKWGLRDGHDWLAQDATALAAVGRLGDVLPRRPTRIVACNVAGAGAAAGVAALAQRLDAPLLWVRSAPSQCGVANRYEDPTQLGADRWAALIGARALHGAACLAINAGTATTIDVLDEDGSFQGGLILPGLDMMRRALAAATAGLPLASGSFAPLPRNTDAAIASGCIAATVGAIERMFLHVAARPRALCLLSGGAAPQLAPHVGLPLRVIDNLVLEGLAQIDAGAAA